MRADPPWCDESMILLEEEVTSAVHVRHSTKAAVCKPRRGLLARPDLASTLILDLQPP